ncbi:hypothetical protein KIK06_10645 [Nocardiopsis sp. EMB25]|uniref:hypothetical protein n=1 Tax=Nocardiopsis sp. EMB25 TaxID=2835867 RepID=UPI002283EE41|nr:hypothetical protein [Nocardiopsis sp. EMB25]MCY9784348.1 hypothetical protein [Nocardiopsis sp. EMB25]
MPEPDERPNEPERTPPSAEPEPETIPETSDTGTAPEAHPTPENAISPPPPGTAATTPASAVFSAESAELTRADRQEHRENARDKREQWTLWLSAATALITLFGIVPGLIITNVQIRSLEAGAELSQIQTEQIQAELTQGQPNFSVRWIEVTSTPGNTTPHREHLQNVLGANVEVDFLTPQESAPDIYSTDNIFDSTLWLNSMECSCPQTRSFIRERGLSIVSTPPYWTFLVVSQDGGQAAYEVLMTAKKETEGRFTINGLAELYTGSDGQLQDTPRGLGDNETVELNLGTMEAGAVAAIPLFLSFAVSDPNAPEGSSGGILIAVSEVYIPTTITYRPASSDRTEEVDVRTPAAQPLVLRDGIVGHG